MSNRYQKLVYWSEEDKCFVGRCPALFLGGVHGDDEAEVYRELCTVVEEHLTSLRKQEKKLPQADVAQFSGKLTLRISPDLHRALALRAASEGDSLNHAIEHRLAQAL